MEEPTPIRTDRLDGSFKSLNRTKAVIREILIVERMMGMEVSPTDAISERFIPNPSRITASCNIFFDVKAIPGFNVLRCF